MAKHRYTTAVCLLIVAVMLLVTTLFMFGSRLGITVSRAEPPYASSLFSTDRVHTLDIVVDTDTWADTLQNASAKEYITCNVVIDGNAVKNVGIRTKGNSSLSTIAMSDTDRYSFKIEFDHYVGGQTYQGLDKLALNNIAQDNTYLKDYLCYQLMVAFGADAPLCSFVYITVNGEDWGLYLAVEGIEEAFAARNYGSDYGQIYKPDNMNMMGGRGNGDEGGFDRMPQGGDMAEMFAGWDGQMPEGFEMPEDFTFPEDFQFPEGFSPPDGFGDAAMFTDGTMPASDGTTPDPAAYGSTETDGDTAPVRQTQAFGGDRGGFGGFGRNNDDIALIYTDDEHDSYQNIFNNAKFNPTDADKDRLIDSIRRLNEGVDLEAVVNVEEVLRYFVVHNFVLNFDSYTGSMLHNYYLYEEDGQISMIAWDYNLSFGAFGMGGMGGFGGMSGGSGTDTATAMVNYPIDTPTSGSSMEDRPLLYQLLQEDTYLDRYHELFAAFIQEYFTDGAFVEMYDSVVALIAPYVEKDPSAFCTYEAFCQATEALRAFCLLRDESVQGQLDGTIPATSEGQAAEPDTLIDASHINMDAMGSNRMGFDRARQRRPEQSAEDTAQSTPGSEEGSQAPPESDDGVSQTPIEGGTEGGTVMPMRNAGLPTGDFTPPESFSADGNFTPPEGFSAMDNTPPLQDNSTPANAITPPDDPARQSPATGADSTDDGATAANPTPDAPTATPESTGDSTPRTQQAPGGMQFGGTPTNAASTQSTGAQRFIYLGVAGVLILAGLLFAGLFKKR